MRNIILFTFTVHLIMQIAVNAGVKSEAPDINYELSNPEDIKDALERVRDHLVRVTPYQIVERKTGEPVTDFNEVKDAYVAKLPGHRIWTYEMGVVYTAMVQCTRVTGDQSFIDYAEKNYQFVVDNLDYLEKVSEKYGYHKERLMYALKPEHLDHCGSMGAAMIKLHKLRPDKRYLPLVDIISNYIMKEQTRLKDGTLARPARGDWEYTLWTDDLYMSIPFLVQMGKFSGDNTYYDEAIKQLLQFAKYLFSEDKCLFDHAWYSHVKYDPHFFWGRQNGWALLAMTEILDVIPEKYPGRDKVLDIFQRNIRSLIELQGRNGLWHQMLDREETYYETSCTAMFTYCVARGLNKGWLENVYGSVAIAGWNAIERKIMEDGQIEGVCTGTSVCNDMVYYANRPQSILAYHGYGPVLLAGSEMLELLNNFDIKIVSNTFQFWRK